MEKNSPDFHILIIDDEMDLLDVIAQGVRNMGFSALVASSPSEGLAVLEKYYNKMALVICDYNMPGMNGLEFRRLMLDKWPGIPFVILSAQVTKEDALKAIDLQISAFLEKPAKLDTLQECVERVAKDRLNSLKEEAELLSGFIAEAEVNIEQAEALVLELEANPQDLELINRIFGLVHTLKGASGFFRPLTLHQFVHKFEDLLSQIKAGHQAITTQVISIILESISTINTLLAELKSGEHVTTDLESLLLVLKVSTKAAARQPTLEKNKSDSDAKQTEFNKELRVSVSLLDEFMYISGEMTVRRNMIDKILNSIEKTMPGNKDIALLSDLVEEMHKINTGIQAKIVEIRKTPIRSIIKSFPRVVRELGSKLNKEVEFQSKGEELLVDTAVAEALNKALIHMVRNSIDHGLELPEARQDKGKPRKGVILISSFLKGEDIFIEISDDGAGIHVEKIKEKLLKNGMSAKQIEQMTDEKILLQLFEPGFSTATVVTEVSGRGVGMDVVKKSITSLKGEISIHTELGKGTKFSLRIPAPRSVHIINSLIVRIGQQKFCLPQDNVVRVVEFSTEQRKQLISELPGARMLNLDGSLIPLIELEQCLNLKISDNHEDRLKIIILKNSTDCHFAISVDEVLDIEDTVVKPLPRFIRQIKAFSGATFMGDGLIGLILSVDGIAEMAFVNNQIAAKSVVLQRAPIKEQNMILFELEHGRGVYAIPQNEVSRLEAWSFKDIQLSGGRWVVPYRGQILSLYDLSFLLSLPGHSEPAASKNKALLSLIISDESSGIKAGLLVKSIIDIVKTEAEPSNLIKEKGISGALLLPGQTITVLNVKELLAA